MNSVIDATDRVGLDQVATRSLEKCMGACQGEQIGIVFDEKRRDIAEAFFRAGNSLGCETVAVEMVERERSGEEPPPVVSELMEACDVVMAITTKSLSHTAARRKACSNGARMASLPGITVDCALRTLAADYASIKTLSEKLAELLTRGKYVRVTNEAGTDICVPVDGRTGLADTGDYTMKGSFGNLPAGEAFLAPVEGGSNGVIVFTSSISGVGICEKPVRVTVENGFAALIEGGAEARVLKGLLEPLGKNAFNVAELGIGTNDKAILTGNVLEDEKVLGTVHIAFGNNRGFGGNVDVPIHLDGMIIEPTVTIDGVMVMEKGILLV